MFLHRNRSGSIQSNIFHFTISQSRFLGFGLIALLLNSMDAKSLESARSPLSFTGAWTSRRSQCSNQEDTYRVVINSQQLVFWESICHIISSQVSHDEQTLKTKCSGEGEKWKEIFTLKKDSEKMIMRSDRDNYLSKTVYIRCR